MWYVCDVLYAVLHVHVSCFDLQYDESALTFTAGSVSLCCVCSHLWFACKVVVVPYVHTGPTRGSGIVSSAADVLWMRGVGGMCEMCRCLARGDVGGEGGEWMRG